ncbi:MAG: hypothetical protein MHM6MM_004861 [Cercozoa sp. M6MM]
MSVYGGDLCLVSNGAGDDESYLEKDIDIDALISSFDTIGLKAGVDFGMDELLSELRVVGQQVREEQKAELEKAMTRNFKENNGEASENSDASKFQQAIADYYQKKHSLSGKQLFHMRRKMARRRRQARQRGQNYNDRRRTRAYGRQSRLKARRRARY